MKTALGVLTILYITICCVYPIVSKENRDIPWFMYRYSIYYIDTRPIYTSQEAQNICMEKFMMFTVSEIDIKGILEYIESVYGHIPSFWTYDNHQYANLLAAKQLPHERQVEENTGSGSCYKLTAHDMHYRQENCNEKMSILCKRDFMGAYLYFVNGTHRNIGRRQVATYCNPHSNDYEYELQLCLIRYFKVTHDVSTSINNRLM